jgi:hypothetical protein
MQTEIAQHALLTPTEAAEYLGVSPDTLNVWRCVGRYSLPYQGRLARPIQEIRLGRLDRQAHERGWG